MKKIFFMVLAMCLLIGCHSDVSQHYQNYPQPVSGSFPSGLTIAQAESVITNACITRGWRITGKEKGQMEIALQKRKYNFYASIAYNEKNYTIHMNEANSPNGLEDFKRTSKLFNNYVLKLDQSIQKQAVKGYARSLEADAYR